MSCIPIQDFSLISLCDATKAGKLYSIVPDDGSGDFDVARNSTATYVGADGLIKTAAINEPRIEFNPDGSYKGLLVEPQRTNLVLRSEEFDDGEWGKVNTIITANDAVAPDGTTTADKIIEDSTTGLHYIQQSISHTSGVVYSVSFFAKAGERTAICLQTGTGLNSNLGNTGQFVSLITGEPLNSLSGVTVTTQLIAGFFRINITFTAASTSTSNIFILLAIGTSVNYAGDGTSGLFLWGAQLEAGSTASSYIPTVASTVTRVADVVSKTGASALIGQTEGTIYVEVDLSIMQAGAIISLNSGSAANRLFIIRNANNSISFISTVSSVGQFTIVSPILSLGNHKIAAAYEAGNNILYVDGVIAGSNASTGIPACSRIDIGGSVGVSQLNDHIKSAAILPTRLSNAQLEALTS